MAEMKQTNDIKGHNMPSLPMNIFPQSTALPVAQRILPPEASNNYCQPFMFDRRSISLPPLVPYPPYLFMNQKQNPQFSNGNNHNCLSYPVPQTMMYNGRPLNYFPPPSCTQNSNIPSSTLWPLTSLEFFSRHSANSSYSQNFFNTPFHQETPKWNNFNVPPYIVSNAPPFKKKKFISKIDKMNRFKFHKSTFRKNNDQYIVDPLCSALLAIGPRRTYCKSIGYVQANSDPDNSNIVSIGESLQVCNDYAAWMQKKIRARPTTENTTIVNVIGRIDLPNDQVEIDIFDLYRFITFAFPHWSTSSWLLPPALAAVYEPDIAPILAIQRIKPKDQKSTPEQFIDFPESSLFKDSAISDSSNDFQDGDSYSSPIQNSKAHQEKAGHSTPLATPYAKSEEASNAHSCPEESFNFSEIPILEEYLAMNNKGVNIKQHTPLGLIAGWMFVEEKRYLHRERHNPSNSATWLNCVILVSPRTIVFHQAQKNEDIEFAWIQFFPLIRHFLIKVSRQTNSSDDLNSTLVETYTNRKLSNVSSAPWLLQMQDSDSCCDIPSSQFPS